MKIPHYAIVSGRGSSSTALIIRDLGPWDVYPSVTNGAEDVVAELVRTGALLPGQRLLYYDSEDQLDEIIVKDGRFVDFAPGPRPRGGSLR